MARALVHGWAGHARGMASKSAQVRAGDVSFSGGRSRSCGIVGAPNIGKSTLFNAMTATQAAQAASYPFCTIDPNIGRVAAPFQIGDRGSEVRRAELTLTRIRGAARSENRARTVSAERARRSVPGLGF